MSDLNLTLRVIPESDAVLFESELGEHVMEMPWGAISEYFEQEIDVLDEWDEDELREQLQDVIDSLERETGRLRELDIYMTD